MKKRTAFIICSLAVQLMTVSAYAAGWDHDMYFSHEKRAIVFDFSESCKQKSIEKTKKVPQSLRDRKWA